MLTKPPPELYNNLLVCRHFFPQPKQGNRQQMEIREFIKLSGFILIITGTAGLLLNEFVWEHSSTRTIIFAVVNFVGLVNLAFAHFGMRGKGR
jgi:hypothetical protein